MTASGHSSSSHNSPGVIRRYGDTDFITGMRATAASMVVVIHTAAFRDFGSVGAAITDAGKYGVDVFFVISGFTIARTFGDATGYRPYLTRRLFRIVPLYWMMITVALLMAAAGLTVSSWMDDLGAEPNLYNWLMHLSLVSYLDYRVANSALGVEWSIPIEIFWYVCLPLILWMTRSIKWVVITVLVVAVINGILAYGAKQMFGSSLAAKWMPFAYGHWFIIGAFAHELRKSVKATPSGREGAYCMVALLLAAVAFCLPISGRGELIALCAVVLIVCCDPSTTPRLAAFLSNRPMLLAGSVSYSIYLVHPMVIAVLESVGVPPGGLGFFALTMVLTVAVSVATYLLIEKPTNRMGARVASRQSA